MEKTALHTFWTFMLLCAGTALGTVWFGTAVSGRLVMSFFIIGLASFFIWAPLVVYRFLEKTG